MSSNSIPRTNAFDTNHAAHNSCGSDGGNAPPNPPTPAQKRLLVPAAKRSQVAADGDVGGGGGGGALAVYILNGGTHTVKKFFSKSRDEDDLGIGVPHWRRVLSNFHPVPGGLQIHGRRYTTVEHAFHAAKARLCSDKPSIAEEFEVGGSVASDPQKAKSAGGRRGFERFGATLDRGAWARECDAATVEALRCRLAQDQLFRRVLVATHRRRIFLLHVDRSGAKSYWGGSISKTTGEVVGRNKLGYMLMDLAAEAVGAASQGGVDAPSPDDDAAFGYGSRPAKLSRVDDSSKSDENHAGDDGN